MNPNPVTASRLKQLREKKNLNQEEFCNAFSEFMGRATVLSVMTVSNWETGRKLPPADTVIWIARFYGVSTDYIFGLTDEGGEISTSKTASLSATIEVPFNELSKHDGEALYVKFPDGRYQNQMALLDYPNRQLVMLKFKMGLTEKCHYFVTVPPEELTIRNQINHLLNLKDVMKMDRVYIESLSPDPYLKGQITGWYKNDVTGKFLINEQGRTLSYEGLGITYNAVDFKSPVKKLK